MIFIMNPWTTIYYLSNVGNLNLSAFSLLNCNIDTYYLSMGNSFIRTILEKQRSRFMSSNTLLEAIAHYLIYTNLS